MGPWQWILVLYVNDVVTWLNQKIDISPSSFLAMCQLSRLSYTAKRRVIVCFLQHICKASTSPQKCAETPGCAVYTFGGDKLCVPMAEGELFTGDYTTTIEADIYVYRRHAVLHYMSLVLLHGFRISFESPSNLWSRDFGSFFDLEGCFSTMIEVWNGPIELSHMFPWNGVQCFAVSSIWDHLTG